MRVLKDFISSFLEGEEGELTYNDPFQDLKKWGKNPLVFFSEVFEEKR